MVRETLKKQMFLHMAELLLEQKLLTQEENDRLKVWLNDRKEEHDKGCNL